MKKQIALLLALISLVGILSGCNTGGNTETTAGKTLDTTATAEDIAHLDSLYQGRNVYQGELHDHANTGGTSDGKKMLSVWKEGMEELGMDFATIVDHKQVHHMYNYQWDNTMFIGGTEASTAITDLNCERNRLHYNMIFADPAGLEAVLDEFMLDFQWSKKSGHFGYPNFTREKFCTLIESIKKNGGFFVFAHPKQSLKSVNSLDYWFADETGLEVFYAFKDSIAGPKTEANYQLWTDLLAAGKRVWATAGTDDHNEPSDKALTTIYAEEKHAQSFLEHLRVGDFVCGGVGIRMCIGDTKMGGQCAYNNQRLIFSVSDMHESWYDPTHSYRIDLLDDQGVVFSQEFDPTQPTYFAIDTQAEAKFYRVEIFDTFLDLRIAIGNPIWNQ